MSAQAKVSQVVTSYIRAMYEWEMGALGWTGNVRKDDDTEDITLSASELDERMKELFESEGIQHIEKQREWILTEYCTLERRLSGYHFGVPTQHHPELEQIVAIKVIDDTHAEVFTDYTPTNSYARQRRYELTLSDEAWLIHQHYLLDEDGEFPEL